MSGLNVSVGYFLVAFALSQVAHPLLNSFNLGNLHNELLASFLLVACWLELQILLELGPWAGGFGLDVSLTLLFLILVIQGLSSRGASGNPSITMQSFLLSKISFLTAFGSMVAHFLGAMFAKLLAKYYWSLELIDMHMFHNMMAQECSSTLRVSVLQGAFTEGICMLILHLLAMRTEELSALLQVTIFAATNTLLTCMGLSSIDSIMVVELVFRVIQSMSCLIEVIVCIANNMSYCDRLRELKLFRLYGDLIQVNKVCGAPAETDTYLPTESLAAHVTTPTGKPLAPSGELSQKRREFMSHMQRFKAFYSTLPKAYCEGDLVGDSSTCWDGEDVVESYTDRTVDIGFDTHKPNHETKVKVQDHLLNKVKEKLQHFNQVIQGKEIQKVSEKLGGSGSGQKSLEASGDCDDEDGCFGSGEAEIVSNRNTNKLNGKTTIDEPVKTRGSGTSTKVATSTTKPRFVNNRGTCACATSFQLILLFLMVLSWNLS
ncbi:GPC5 protein, partial [Polypterus senegalus]